MLFELNEEELAALRGGVERQIRAMRDELAHTEAHPMQVELAREVHALERIRDKLCRPAAPRPEIRHPSA